MHGAERLHRVDAVTRENFFARGKHPVQLFQRTLQAILMRTCRHPADVRETLNAAQATAGQVHAVHRHLAGGVGEGDGCGEGAEEGTATRLGGTDHRNVAAAG